MSQEHWVKRLLLRSWPALGLLMAALGPSTAGAAPLLRYALAPDSSQVRIRTGSSGVFGFAGHEHEIAAGHFTGTAVIDSSDVTKVQLSITVPTDSMRVVDEDESAETRAKVERAMHEQVLETKRFPEITIRGVTFKPVGDEPGHPGPALAADTGGELVIELTLHGVTRTMALPVDIQVDRAHLRARGKFPLRHKDFDLKRVKVAGVVNVADTFSVEFDLRGTCLGPEPVK
jgi:polyisoprenoid-binding protein YceI